MKRLLLGFAAFVSGIAATPVNVAFSPARPTVGDVVTITFPADVRDVTVLPSIEYEVVRADGRTIALRSFRPGPLPVRGKWTRHPGPGTRDFTLNVTIASVLQPNDSLQPANLKPPRPLPPSRAARVAIAAAAAAALLSWAAVLLRARGRREAEMQPVQSALQEFRAALVRVERIRDPNQKIIFLAEATRIYLARADATLRRELTTFELLRKLPPGESGGTIRDLLTAADLAKFSPWGAELRDHSDLIACLRRLPEFFERPSGERAA